jgi:hypothetical protein
MLDDAKGAQHGKEAALVGACTVVLLVMRRNAILVLDTS